MSYMTSMTSYFSLQCYYDDVILKV